MIGNLAQELAGDRSHISRVFPAPERCSVHLPLEDGSGTVPVLTPPLEGLGETLPSSFAPCAQLDISLPIMYATPVGKTNVPIDALASMP